MEGVKKIFSKTQLAEFGVYHFMDQFFGRKLLYRLMKRRREKFNKKIFETLEKSGEGKVVQIERRKDLSLKEFNNHYRKKGIPVVMEGAAKDWDCVKNWSLDYFKQMHGNDVVALTDYRIANTYETTTLKEIIEDIQGKGSKYYRFYPLLRRHPEHIRDFDYKWLLERRNHKVWFEAWQVFMGGTNSITSLHIENQCNLFTQASGKKKWIIYPDYYSPAFNPPPARAIYRISQIKAGCKPFDSFYPDYENYPEYRYLDRLETVLEPGDVLFNPCYAWHTVKNETDSISVAYRWVSAPYAFRRNPLFMFMDMLARNPSIWKGFKMYVEDFNLVRVAESGNLDKYLKEKAELERQQKLKAASN
jgi:hypothetical protein